MRYFIDTEFNEAGPNKPIVLLSLAIVSEDGREFYAVNADANLDDCNDWVKEHVVPQLGSYRIRFSEFKQAILNFVGPNPEFWGYYADYDWVVFCQLFGTMIELPEGWPMYCRDLKQVADERGIKLPTQSSQEHNALNDARWNLEAWRATR